MKRNLIAKKIAKDRVLTGLEIPQEIIIKLEKEEDYKNSKQSKKERKEVRA